MASVPAGLHLLDVVVEVHVGDVLAGELQARLDLVFERALEGVGGGDSSPAPSEGSSSVSIFTARVLWRSSTIPLTKYGWNNFSILPNDAETLRDIFWDAEGDNEVVGRDVT